MAFTFIARQLVADGAANHENHTIETQVKNLVEDTVKTQVEKCRTNPSIASTLAALVIQRDGDAFTNILAKVICSIR